jgi:hypothetical protein
LIVKFQISNRILYSLKYFATEFVSNFQLTSMAKSTTMSIIIWSSNNTNLLSSTEKPLSQPKWHHVTFVYFSSESTPIFFGDLGAFKNHNHYLLRSSSTRVSSSTPKDKSKTIRNDALLCLHKRKEMYKR